VRAWLPAFFALLSAPFVEIVFLVLVPDAVRKQHVRPTIQKVSPFSFWVRDLRCDIVGIHVRLWVCLEALAARTSLQKWRAQYKVRFEISAHIDRN